MEEAPLRDIRELAWFERNLDAAVSALFLDENRLIAGDWDGAVHCWDLEGERIWKAQTSNRVANFAVGGNHLFAVCGRDIVCMNIESGEIAWEVELEGSSDLVAALPDGSEIFATSSVFDLEMNDFLESTLWRFDSQGNILRRDAIDERPWSIEMRNDGVVFLSLSRPRCGIIRADKEGLHHIQLATSSPATCGFTGKPHSVIGHADGTLTGMDGGMVLDDDTYTNQPGSVESISGSDDGLLVAIAIESGAAGASFGGAEGIARAYDSNGALRWQIETPLGCNIEHVSFGPTIETYSSAWAISWDGRTGFIESRSAIEGSPILRTEIASRINCVVGDSEYIGFGFDNGSVILLQGELLNRRLSEDEVTEADEHKSALAEKLRRLRS